MMSFLGNLICYHSFELSDISSQITALGSRDEEKENCLVLCFCFICMDCISLLFFFQNKGAFKISNRNDNTHYIPYSLVLMNQWVWHEIFHLLNLALKETPATKVKLVFMGERKVLHDGPEESPTQLHLLSRTESSPNSSSGTVPLPLCAFFSCVPISCHPDLSFSGPLLATCWWMTLGQLQTSQNSLELCSRPSQKFWFLFIGKLQNDKKYYEFNTFKQTCILFTTIASTNFQKIIVHRCAKHTRCSGWTGIMGLSNSAATEHLDNIINVFRTNNPTCFPLKFTLQL